MAGREPEGRGVLRAGTLPSWRSRARHPRGVRLHAARGWAPPATTRRSATSSRRARRRSASSPSRPICMSPRRCERRSTRRSPWPPTRSRSFAAAGLRVFFDAEHFFDGYRRDPSSPSRVLSAAEEAGAEALVLCDTNGGTMPDEVERIVAEVRGLRLGDASAAISTTTAVAPSPTPWRRCARVPPRCRAV